MIKSTSVHEYVQLFKAYVSRCGAIPAEDRSSIVAKPVKRRNIWLIARGISGDKGLAEMDPVASSPFELIHGGRLALEVRVREIRQRASRATEVIAYRFSCSELPRNPNGIECLRYDKPEAQRRGGDWDKELGDNPRHPWAHLHVNFATSTTANDSRLPTGRVCPILLLRAFDFWYCSTFGE